MEQETDFDQMFWQERNRQDELKFGSRRQGRAEQGTSYAKFSTVFLATLLGFASRHLFSYEPRQKLEDHSMCGVTTGGKEECFWDCQVISPQGVFSQIVTNPQCLIDCFNNSTSYGTPHPPKSAPTNPNHCVHHLLYDLGVGGICANKFASAINIQVNPDCTFDPTGSVILNGTCSTETEKLLLNSACKRDIFEQPGFIVNTILLLIVSSCKGTVSQDYLEFCQEAKCELFSGDIPGIPRLHGPEVVAELDNYTLVTKLNYANTRHRYPWVCSLRTLGSNPDHLCAVTLLSVPPKPTVVVSAAHCTYLCKNSKGAMVSSCCCDDGPRNCAEQEEKCGTNPKVFEMSGKDAKIVCGEWETGSVPKDISMEEYNIILEIEEIIRHPSFNTSKGAGPLMGGDIAVFKVFDSKLKTETIKKYKLYPSCLPKIANERKSGIHTGWAKPPPFHFLERRTPGFLRFYRDYFTQWHYKMSILPKCKDPLTDPLTGQQLVGPTNTFYPAGTVCAREVTSRSCFSTGDSGSPLLVSMKGSQSRFYTEGILSFTKGCDFLILQTDVLTVSEFDFGSKPKWILNQVTENPSVYTKLSCYLPWIAAMYNMDYETSQVVDPECYQAQGVQVDQNQKECITKYSDLTAQIDGEVPCIFPYYFNGVKYDQCYAFEFEGFLYPQFFCPVRNITTKKLGINSFEKSDVILPGLCLSDQSDPLSPLDPEKQDCTVSQRRIPYSFCKNDCVGVRGGFGLIGGGAILGFTAGISLLGNIIPLIGVGGALGTAGLAAQTMCAAPFYCTAASGQCCLVVFTAVSGLACPESC